MQGASWGPSEGHRKSAFSRTRILRTTLSSFIRSARPSLTASRHLSQLPPSRTCRHRRATFPSTPSNFLSAWARVRHPKNAVLKHRWFIL